MQEFIPNTETYSLPPSSTPASEPTREPVRVILIGSAVGINLVIGTCPRLGLVTCGSNSSALLRKSRRRRLTDQPGYRS